METIVWLSRYHARYKKKNRAAMETLRAWAGKRAQTTDVFLRKIMQTWRLSCTVITKSKNREH